MRRIHNRRLAFVWNLFKICILLGMVGVLGYSAVTIYGIYKVLPSPGAIVINNLAEPTKIYSSDGVLLARVRDAENREVVPITAIKKDLQNATVAIEDSRFYTHSGLDAKGIMRALYENLRGGRVSQGGSTITQQLARNIYLTQRRTVTRKLQEMLLAREIERRLSKQEILELYLNQVCYGSGAFGVKAAAHVYFGKQISDLSLAECALLAGLPQRPTYLSPYEDMDAAIRRRNTVLSVMAEQGYITQAEAEEAKQEKVHLVGLRAGRSRKTKAPHFVDYVIKQLEAKYGADEVHHGGLEVYTTLNMKMQEEAERAIREQVMLARRRGNRIGQGAVVALDPNTGFIRVMVGSLDYHDPNGGMYNRTVQARRQPGSTFKAFVYTTAIDNGYRPTSVLRDAPLHFPDGWSPKNFDGRYRGSVTIRTAIENSINTAAVRMLQKVGIDKVIEYAHRMGIKSPLQHNLSLALGTSEVTPLELTAAYGVFPTGGWYTEPTGIQRVVARDGTVLEDASPRRRRVLSSSTAETMADLFRDVVRHGTGRTARVIRDAGGKTGTTQNLRDAWFVGFTKDLVAAVWVGNDNNAPMREAAFGGTVCAPVWVDLMRTALPIIARSKDKDRPKVTDEPSDVQPEERSTRDDERRNRDRNKDEQDQGETVYREICTESGQIASPSCPSWRRVGFARGSEPTQTCVIHGSSEKQSGALESPDQTETTPEEPAQSGDTEKTPRHHAAEPSRHQRSETSARTVDVPICVQSGRRANEYCPEVMTRKVPAGQVPGTCTTHGPSNGQ